MKGIQLSILIPSTISRKEMTDNLVFEVLKQGMDMPIDVLLDWDENNCIGKKRNDLLNRATGEYIVFIDSDDEISGDYISKILAAIETGPDCIGISGTITTDGQDERQWHISIDYGMWYQQDSIYFRTPNHISPVRRELALKAGFPEISHGEDYQYSMALLPMLKTEIKITGNIYHYDYWQK